jgi:hypothetical protein
VAVNDPGRWQHVTGSEPQLTATPTSWFEEQLVDERLKRIAPAILVIAVIVLLQDDATNQLELGGDAHQMGLSFSACMPGLRARSHGVKSKLKRYPTYNDLNPARWTASTWTSTSPPSSSRTFRKRFVKRFTADIRELLAEVGVR